MKRKAKQHIFFVDDEPALRKVVRRTLQRTGLKVTCFASAADCLKKLHSVKCDLLITDVKMPKMDGIELLTEAKRIVPWLQVLVITGYGDIPMAVRAIKAGATNFIEKPLDRQGFLSTVELILKRDVSTDPLLGKPLTKTEVKVLRFILEGKSSREIADLQNRAKRTIDFHRWKIYRKLGVDNLLGLFKRSAEMGLVQLSKNDG
ncbi:MAG: response regulator transcription factor [Planctomycetota bacterium]|jgi:FixJ family two-component response regulator